MAQPYRLIANSDGVLRIEDQAHIPNDGGNRDWQEYQAWLAEGNTPDPAPPPPDPPPPEPVQLPAAMPERPLDAVPKVYLDDVVNPLIARLEALERRLG
jgi:hypothetical protein